MKGLSLWQPWASAITLGLKRVETRGRDTRLRGRIAIHAARRWTTHERKWARHFAETRNAPALLEPPLGALVGVASIVATFPAEALAGQLSADEIELGDHGPGRWCWMLEDVVAFRDPIPYRGMQGPFDVPDDLVRDAIAAGNGIDRRP